MSHAHFARIGALASIPWLLAAASAAAATGHDARWRSVPLPILDGGKLTLRVVHVVNPRFPAFGPGQLETMLASARTVARRHFGLEVAFAPWKEMTIAAAFDRIPARAKERARTWIFREDHGREGITALLRSTHARLESQDVTVASAIGYARPYLRIDAEIRDLETLTLALVQQQVAGFRGWHDLLAGDGRPVITPEPYNEWSMWGVLGYGDLEYDVVITNQFVASVEYTGNSIHTALRGGVTVGSTFYNRRGALGGYVLASTLLFADAMESFRQEKGYGKTEAARLAGASLAHEIGHLALHLGHPYGEPACVMSPVPMFRFRAWREGLDPSRCRVGSHPQMTPGAVSFQFDPDLVE